LVWQRGGHGYGGLGVPGKEGRDVERYIFKGCEKKCPVATVPSPEKGGAVHINC